MFSHDMESQPSTSKVLEKFSKSVPQSNVSEASTSNKDFEKHIKLPINSQGIVRFFIKDLWKYTKQDRYFIVRNIPFIYVEICGVIVDKNVIKNNISVKVHDGTGVMNCLIDQHFFSKIPSLPQFNNIPEVQTPISNAAKMLLSNLKHLHSSFVLEKDLMLGNTVILQGKMSEYGGTLYVFVQKINLRTTAQYVAYLQTGLQWYKDLL